MALVAIVTGVTMLGMSFGEIARRAALGRRLQRSMIKAESEPTFRDFRP